ncbi:N-acetyltransferase domain-containing protein [Flavobacterium longum]|uniref:GNAT family N-acetyltransferase n=1 Tax=Flavobacterium longum TaxID=1299340 RepID=UPI0039E88470
MNEIRKIYKKDIPALLDDADFWSSPFLSISRHRLYAHWQNPDSDPEDIALLLAYADGHIAGYMGVYIDKILLDGTQHKIGWLSTWWVHPRTKGTGIGRNILDTMYAENKGKIGISQFTPSAKRVYDKSGYFYTLKESVGIKAVLRSDMVHLVPALYPKLKFLRPVWKVADAAVNALYGIKVWFHKRALAHSLAGIEIDYVTTLDAETDAFVQSRNSNHIARKSKDFYHWMKSCRWVEDAPLLDFTQRSKYEFSMYDKGFEFYLMKIVSKDAVIGFMVLQKRHKTMKVLYVYSNPEYFEILANIIKLQAIEQDMNEIICYDKGIVPHLKSSGLFLYRRKKVKHSIISKVFEKENFDDVVMNFGDGDCSFA